MGGNAERLAAKGVRSMSIAAISSAHVAPTGGEKVEGPGPDHDGDADDAKAAGPAAQASPAPGTGVALDKTA